jgi:hypothetical protein
MIDRPIFEVRLQPTPQVSDPIKALRFFLKVALRTYGLRATSVREITEAST